MKEDEKRMKRESFIFHDSFRRGAKRLPDEHKLTFFDAIIDYGLDGTEPSFPNGAEWLYSLWEMVVALIDSDRTRYEQKCLKNRENGSKGGRPKKQSDNTMKPNGYSETERLFEKPKKTERLFEKPKKPDSDSDNDKEINKENTKRKTACSVTADANTPTPTPKTEEEQNYEKWLSTYFRKLSVMEKPLTLKEYRALCDKFGQDATCETMQDFENSNKYKAKDYKSAYLTMQNWCKQRKR